MCRKTPFDKVKFEFRYAHSRGQKLFFQFWCFLNVDFHCNCGAVLFMSALARIGLPGCVHYSLFPLAAQTGWNQGAPGQRAADHRHALVHEEFAIDVACWIPCFVQNYVIE